MWFCVALYSIKGDSLHSILGFTTLGSYRCSWQIASRDLIVCKDMSPYQNSSLIRNKMVGNVDRCCQIVTAKSLEVLTSITGENAYHHSASSSQDKKSVR
ncbi:hypothetical protein ACMFMF_009458 [Clarireedia jacksonii]